MQLAHLADSFESHYDHHHDPTTGGCREEQRHFCYAVSVNCIPGLDVSETALAAKRLNPSIRVSSPERIEAAGFAIERTPHRADGHCDVYLVDPHAGLPDTFQLLALQQAFDPPQENPGRPK